MATLHILTPRARNLDAQIDRLIYKLYGLTEDEIAIVENAIQPNPSLWTSSCALATDDHRSTHNTDTSTHERTKEPRLE